MNRQTSEGNAPVALVCAVFLISRAAYYAAKKRAARKASDGARVVPRQEHPRFAPAARILEAIRAIVATHPAWGVRKVWAVLRREHGLQVGKNRVYALMKQEGLVLPPDRFPAPLPRGTVAVAEPNRLWASDVTTVYTRLDGWVAVTPTIDCGCRSVLACETSIAQDALTILSSMRTALRREFGDPGKVPDELEWRTDHGPQFTGADARDLCEEWHVDHTFSPVGRPTGNAVAERVIRTMKEEVLWLRDFDTLEQVRAAIEAWVVEYNTRRPHQAIRFQTPAEVRAAKLLTALEAA